MSTEFTLPEGVAEQLAFVGKPLDWPGQDASLRSRATNFKSKVDEAAELENLKQAALAEIPAELQGDPRIAKLMEKIGKATSVSQVTALIAELNTAFAIAKGEGDLKEHIEQGEMSAEARAEAYERKAKEAYSWLKEHGYGDKKYEEDRAAIEEEQKKHKKDSAEWLACEEKKAGLDKDHFGETETKAHQKGDTESEKVAHDARVEAEKREQETKRLRDKKKEGIHAGEKSAVDSKDRAHAPLAEYQTTFGEMKNPLVKNDNLPEDEIGKQDLGYLPSMAKAQRAPKDNSQGKGNAIG